MTLQTTNLLKNLFLFESQLHESRRLGSLGGMLLGNRKKLVVSETVDPRRGSEGSWRGQVSLGSPTHGSGGWIRRFILRFFMGKKITWIVLNVEKKNLDPTFFLAFWSLIVVQNFPSFNHSDYRWRKNLKVWRMDSQTGQSEQPITPLRPPQGLSGVSFVTTLCFHEISPH